MPTIGWKEIALFLGLTLMSIGLIWLGFTEGNWLTFGVGIFSFAFFGLGGAYAVWISLRPARPVKAGTSSRAFFWPRKPVPPPAPRRFEGPRPTLSPEDRAEFDRVFDVLCGQDVFAPQIPDREALYAPTADYGAPLKADTPIDALFGASYFDGDFERELYDQNLRYHFGKVEQTPDEITSQITNLIDLSDGALRAEGIEVIYGENDKVTVTCILNEKPLSITYLGAAKYLSTVVLHRVARIYSELQEPYRFAGLFSDGGLYVMRLKRGGVEALNPALGDKITANAAFFWLDEPGSRFESGGS